MIREPDHERIETETTVRLQTLKAIKAFVKLIMRTKMGAMFFFQVNEIQVVKLTLVTTTSH